MPVPFTTLAGWHDVFQEILNHLEPRDSYDEDDENDVYFAAYKAFRGTLFSLALSSQALSDPSLDKLWRSPGNISPLFKLLPNYRLSGLTHYLTGHISPEAWTRFQAYASRVHSIGVDRQLDYDIHPSVWTAIHEQSQGGPLFPNLSHLDAVISNVPHAVSSICLFISPSLRTVSLSFHGVPGGLRPNDAAITTASDAAASVMQELAAKSPQVNRLFVRRHLNLPRQRLADLSRFTQLEVLDVNYHLPFDEDLFPMLVNLKHLTRLEVSILLQNPANASQLDLKGGFQKLTRLVLGGPHAHLARFILASSLPRLTYLCLAVGSHPIDGINASLASICRHIGPHTLTLFRLELGQFHHPPPCFATLLPPILSLANLEEAQFFFSGHTPLRDEDLESLARAWPKLRTLIFMQDAETVVEPDRDPGSVERPTLHALVELARGCPQLEMLCIPDLDATSVPPAEGVPLTAHGPLSLCIQNLVGAEGEEKQLDVAIVLDRLFPRLKLRYGIHQLPGWGGNYNRFLEESKNIVKLLRAIQAARMHYPGGF